MVVLHAKKEALWVLHKPILWKKDSRSDLGGINTFYWNCFQKDLLSLQPGALVSVWTNVQGFENVMTVNSRNIFCSYRYYSFKVLDELLCLDWAQLLIPLAVLGKTPF